MSSVLNDDESIRKTKRIKLAEDESSNLIKIYSDQIFNNELILNHIFKHLTPKQLQSISRVNKDWYRISSKLIKQNSKLEDLFLIFGLSAYMKKNQVKYSKINLVKDVENFDNLKDEIIDFMTTQLNTVPVIALFFHTFRSLKQKHYSAFINNTKLLKLLPKSCSIMNLSSDDTGIIGRIHDNRYSIETLQDHRFISGISFIFIPDLSIYGCKIIPINGTCQSELYDHLNDDKIIENNIKGAIVFYKFNANKSPDVGKLFELLNGKNRIALGGVSLENIDVSSTVNSTDLKDKTMLKTDFSALLFCGQNINCASLVIKSAEKEEIKTLLSDFKNNLHFNCNEPNSEFIGFLFACAGRGFNIFNELNTESDLIKERFPNLKLYGVFGLGELGINYYGDFRNSNRKVKELLHYYTSILVLVQINKNRL